MISSNLIFIINIILFHMSLPAFLTGLKCYLITVRVRIIMLLRLKGFDYLTHNYVYAIDVYSQLCALPRLMTKAAISKWQQENTTINTATR